MKTPLLSIVPALLLSWALSGCASGPRFQKDGVFSSKAVLLSVPFQRQADPNLCGVAVMGMLTQYFGKTLPDRTLEGLKKEAAEKKGIKGSSLMEAFKEGGYQAAIFAGTLDRKTKGLYHHLDLHRPVIVMLSPEGAKENHFELVSGYDPETSLISVLDPAKGPLVLPLPAFKAAWERANFFTLLAVPEEGAEPAKGNKK